MRQVMPGLRDLEILHAQAVRSRWLAVSTQLCKKVIMRAKWGPFYMIWHVWKHKWSHGYGTMEFNGAYDSVQRDQKKSAKVTWPSRGHFWLVRGLFWVNQKAKGAQRKVCSVYTKKTCKKRALSCCFSE